MRFVCAVILLACGRDAPEISIATAHGSAAERQTREDLADLLDRYDLSPWRSTRRVTIDEDAIPHSHPVLTLHTRHLGDPDMLLATYVHEQIHWQVDAEPAKLQRALTRLRARYPSPPVGFPEGARNQDSSWLHLVVCWLELEAMKTLLGDTRARALMARQDHYTWIYARVLEDAEIGNIVKAAGLAPN